MCHSHCDSGVRIRFSGPTTSGLRIFLSPSSNRSRRSLPPHVHKRICKLCALVVQITGSGSSRLLNSDGAKDSSRGGLGPQTRNENVRKVDLLRRWVRLLSSFDGWYSFPPTLSRMRGDEDHQPPLAQHSAFDLSDHAKPKPDSVADDMVGAGRRRRKKKGNAPARRQHTESQRGTDNRHLHAPTFEPAQMDPVIHRSEPQTKDASTQDNQSRRIFHESARH